MYKRLLSLITHMRSRKVKPNFFKNEYLAELPPEARLLYIGLWCLADREGRVEDAPKRIKAELFPYDDYDVDILLDGLNDQGFIHRYGVNGSGCISVPKFKLHQSPHRNEKPSLLPAPGDITNVHEHSRVVGECSRNFSTKERKKEISPSSSPLPPPSTSSILVSPPIPTTPNPSLERKKENGDLASVDSPEFQVFWRSYPRKLGKGQARRAYKTALGKVNAAAILDGLNQWLPLWEGKSPEFIPYPSTWLNGEHWADELETTSIPGRVFSPEEESEITAALAIYRQGDYAKAQEMVSDELWVEVMRRGKA